MAIDYSLFAFGKGTPSALRDRYKKRERESLLSKAYKKVDERDGVICRVTGKKLIKSLPGGTIAHDQWLTRHHMKARSTHPEERDNPKNIFVCSWAAHKLLETGVLLVEGEDADTRLVFTWNRTLIAPSKEPFRIRSKRRSQ